MARMGGHCATQTNAATLCDSEDCSMIRSSTARNESSPTTEYYEVVRLNKKVEQSESTGLTANSSAAASLRSLPPAFLTSRVQRNPIQFILVYRAMFTFL